MKSLLVLILFIGFFCRQEVLAEETGSLVVVCSWSGDMVPVGLVVSLRGGNLCNDVSLDQRDETWGELTPGVYTLFCYAFTYESCLSSVTVQPGQTTVVHVTLEASCGVVFVCYSESMIDHYQIGTVRTIDLSRGRSTNSYMRVNDDCDEDVHSTIDVIGVFEEN